MEVAARASLSDLLSIQLQTPKTSRKDGEGEGEGRWARIKRPQEFSKGEGEGKDLFISAFFCRVSSSLKGLESERGTEIDRGPYLNDVYTIFGILDPPPPPLSAFLSDS